MNLIKKINLYIKRAYFMGHYPSIFKIIFSKKKKLVYYGFLGDGNFGDELVYQATKELFSDCLVIPYLRHMPIETRLYLNYYKKYIYGVVIGGGTLIRTFSSDKLFFLKMRSLNKPVYFHGTGTDEILKDDLFWKKFITSNGLYGGVRGVNSVNYLLKNGYKFSAIGDAALYLKQAKDVINKKKLIILNFGTHANLHELKRSREEIVKFLKSEEVQNYRIGYLPMHAIDVQLGIELKKEIKTLELYDIATSFEVTTRQLSEAEFCIGERLHFIVMCVMANTRFVSVNYDKKHIDFLSSVELQYLGVAAKNIKLDLLKNQFLEEKKINWNQVNRLVNTHQNTQQEAKQCFLRHCSEIE